MNVTIWYCELCHLQAPAEAIAAALEEQFGLKCELKQGFWGTFLVEYQGREIFNRWKHRGVIGRLGFGATPRPEEIVERLRPLLATA